MYPAIALPGSPLYKNAINQGANLPEQYDQFSFHSYETIPFSTKFLKAPEILKLRDEKFNEYFKREEFLSKILEKFGKEAVTNIKKMTKIKLKRRIIDEHKSYDNN